MSGSQRQYPRSDRVRRQIQEVLVEELERLRDPGVGYVTITEVTMSTDMRHATAYYTVLGNELDRAGTGDALQRATAHLRAAIAKKMSLRYMPELEMKEDPVPTKAGRIDKLIADLNRKDDV